MRFRCEYPAENIARALSRVIYEEHMFPTRNSVNVPFKVDSGGWWELSEANDHKLDVHGDNEFTFRDRYHNPERLQRVLVVLETLGAQRLDITPLELLSQSHKNIP